MVEGSPCSSSTVGRGAGSAPAVRGAWLRPLMVALLHLKRACMTTWLLAPCLLVTMAGPTGHGSAGRRRPPRRPVRPPRHASRRPDIRRPGVARCQEQGLCTGERVAFVPLLCPRDAVSPPARPSAPRGILSAAARRCRTQRADRTAHTQHDGSLVLKYGKVL